MKKKESEKHTYVDYLRGLWRHLCNSVKNPTEPRGIKRIWLINQVVLVAVASSAYFIGVWAPILFSYLTYLFVSFACTQIAALLHKVYALDLIQGELKLEEGSRRQVQTFVRAAEENWVFCDLLAELPGELLMSFDPGVTPTLVQEILRRANQSEESPLHSYVEHFGKWLTEKNLQDAETFTPAAGLLGYPPPVLTREQKLSLRNSILTPAQIKDRLLKLPDVSDD